MEDRLRMQFVGAATRGRCISFLILACVLAGCSGIRPYQSTPAKNLHLRTTTETGSPFSSVRAAVDIYRVDAGCHVQYEGTVDLDDSSQAIGIPADQPSYLSFAFASTSWLGSSQSSISYDTLLTPRSGYRYDVEVTYLDDIYDVSIRELPPRNGPNRVIDQQPLEDCAIR